MKTRILLFGCLIVFRVSAEEITSIVPTGKITELTSEQRAFLSKQLEINRKKQKEDTQRYFVNLSPVHIYGRVVDQFGAPIAKAEIEMHWSEYDVLPVGVRFRTESRSLSSDAEGLFDLKIEKGNRISIQKIAKTGYEYPFGWYPAQAGEGALLDSTADSPVVLKMRKKEETRFLVGFSSSFMVKAPGGTNFYDLVLGKGATSDQMESDVFADMRPDLMFRAVYSAGVKTWIVSFSTIRTNDGIVAEYPFAYKAPAEGYVREINFKISGRDSLKEVQCLYLKGRNGAIHSRIEVGPVSGDDRFISIGFRAVTNPYGDRILEKETDLPWKVERQLKEDAVGALSEGRLPAKPDLAKIKAENARIK